MPTRIRSRSVHPCTIAACPIVTSSPIVVGCVPCHDVHDRAVLHVAAAPIRIQCTSPRTTAFIQTLLSADLDVADHLGALIDERGRMHRGVRLCTAGASVDYTSPQLRSSRLDRESPPQPLLLDRRVGNPQLLEVGLVARRVVVVLPHLGAVLVHRRLVQLDRRRVLRRGSAART